MKERFPGTDPKPHEIIPTRAWSDDSRRTAFEQHYKTPLGTHGYEFNASQHDQIMAVDVVANGVLAAMNRDAPGLGFETAQHLTYDNSDGTFSGGVLLFGASTRELAERYQPDFEHRMNDVLAMLDANIRFSSNTPPPN